MRAIHLRRNHDFGFVFRADPRRSRLIFFIFELIVVRDDVAHFVCRSDSFSFLPHRNLAAVRGFKLRKHILHLISAKVVVSLHHFGRTLPILVVINKSSDLVEVGQHIAPING